MKQSCASATGTIRRTGALSTHTELWLVTLCARPCWRSRNRPSDGHAGAALSLFVAERVRRHLKEDLGRGVTRSKPPRFAGSLRDLYGAVLRGSLAPPASCIGKRPSVLLTLMCEGGLPLQLLKRDNQRLTAYFRELLSAREAFPHTPTSLLASRCSDRLPASLRQGVVFELGARLIDVVAQLRVVAASATNPLRALDALKRTGETRSRCRLGTTSRRPSSKTASLACGERGPNITTGAAHGAATRRQSSRRADAPFPRRHVSAGAGSAALAHRRGAAAACLLARCRARWHQAPCRGGYGDGRRALRNTAALAAAPRWGSDPPERRPHCRFCWQSRHRDRRAPGGRGACFHPLGLSGR